MKKIGILTLYDSFNYGAFLQAFALSEYLKNKGYDVKFIENKQRDRLIKWIKSKNIKKIFFNIKQASKYIQAQKYFKTIKMDETFDIVFIGSDEIWNVNNKSFPNRKQYFGYGINAKKIVAYAPSCNNATMEDIKRCYPEGVNLGKFDAIAVRDNTTVSLIEGFGIKDFKLVLDPTFLIDSYQKVLIEKDMKNYILIYGYVFSKEQIEEIKEIAKKENKKLIAIGLYQEWCDLNIKATPFEFLGYMKKASKIITATFHGTIFSIIFNKEFITYSNKKKKIEELLAMFELDTRDASKNGINDIIKTSIDYNKVNNIKKEKIECSKRYIDNILT